MLFDDVKLIFFLFSVVFTQRINRQAQILKQWNCLSPIVCFTLHMLVKLYHLLNMIGIGWLILLLN